MESRHKDVSRRTPRVSATNLRNGLLQLAPTSLVPPLPRQRQHKYEAVRATNEGERVPKINVSPVDGVSLFIFHVSVPVPSLPQRTALVCVLVDASIIDASPRRRRPGNAAAAALEPAAQFSRRSKAWDKEATDRRNNGPERRNRCRALYDLLFFFGGKTKKGRKR